MRLMYVTFNFKSADIEAEERNYFDNHVALARRLPGLRFYYVGRLIRAGGKDPERLRAAILGFDDERAWEAALVRSEYAAPLAADTQAHITGIQSRMADGEVIVPFEPRRAGQGCFVMAAEFDLEQSSEGLEPAEKHYREVHVEIARRLPGLRNYMIGKLIPANAPKPDRYRAAILAFDSLDALRAAYRSPIGRELVRDEEATIRNARLCRIDARLEV